MIEPDSGHTSASLFVHTAPLDDQLFRLLALSNPPSLMTFAALGVRHTQVLFVQLKVPDGQSETELHCLQLLLTQTGADDEHVPQVYVPPQPSAAEPQLLPEHAVPIAVLLQPHTFAVPAPAQVCGEVHVPQVYVPPQPFETEPHLPAQTVAIGVGTHWHVVGVPEHASLLAQAVQWVASAQPLLASVVTQLVPHFLVPAPHVPRTQLEF